MKEVQRNKKKNRKNEKKEEKAADEVLSGEVDWEVYYSKVRLKKKTQSIIVFRYLKVLCVIKINIHNKYIN